MKMSTRQSTLDTRNKIIAACSNLLYKKGFGEMSFSDMANASGVPRGNFYYHFKSKDEILKAVIAYRLDRMKRLLAGWQEEFSTPLDRLKRYASVPFIDRHEVAEYGCPIGSLNTELAKNHHELQKVARRQFDFFKDWLSDQFAQLRPDLDSSELAMQMLIKGQGLSVMSVAYGDEKLIEQEVERMKQWLDDLAAKKF